MAANRAMQHPSQQQPIRPVVVYADDAAAGWWPELPRTCQYGACGGRLVAVPPALLPGYVACRMCGREVAEIHPHRLRVVTPGELRVLPAPKPRRRRPLSHQRHPCMDCRSVLIGYGRRRCLSCNRRYRETLALPSRLIGHLASGQPVHRDRLCDLLGISPASFRHVIQKVRRAGYRITRTSGSYRLEATPL